MNLEQQRKRAKDLLRAYRRDEPEAIRRVRRHHPRAVGDIRLADAQLVVAREAGFPSWARMKHGHVASSLHEAVRAGSPLTEALERAQLWELREALEIAVERDDRDAARLLLARGAWVDQAGRRWGRGGSALHAALLLGRDLAMIELLLDGGASLSVRDPQQHTPLAIAVRVARGDAEALFRSRGARDEEASDGDGRLGACLRGEHPAGTATWHRSDHQYLCWAVRSGHVAAISALLAIGLDVDARDDDGDTALHLAVSAGSMVAVEALLAGHPQVDAVDFRGETPLTRALRDGEEAIADRLLRAGALPQERVDLTERFEEAADAVVDGDLAKLGALLDGEPRLVHARSLHDHRCTLLHYVAASGVEADRQRTPPNAAAVAELLLARGADPNALALVYGAPGQPVLGLAITCGFPHQAGVMPALVRALAAGGATVNGPDGQSPIPHAFPSAWEALVEHGATIDLGAAAALGRLDRVHELVTRDGALQPGAQVGSARPAQEVKDLAFLAACDAKQTAVAAYLLDVGARIDVPGSEGMTGLHQAVYRCDCATARMLVDRGAPLEAKNVYGGTVLDFAVWVIKNRPSNGGDWRALVGMLIAAGADLDAAGGKDAIEAALRNVADSS
jgi:ankyrin repeat protein